jgi:hypothetical protein
MAHKLGMESVGRSAAQDVQGEVRKRSLSPLPKKTSQATHDKTSNATSERENLLVAAALKQLEENPTTVQPSFQQKSREVSDAYAATGKTVAYNKDELEYLGARARASQKYGATPESIKAEVDEHMAAYEAKKASNASS